jgi:hypothetical protein
MSLTDAELFDIIEPRHPCAGAATLSLEDFQLRMHQRMQDLKIDERVAQSKEAITRTWATSSTKVRDAVGSAWTSLEQYRQRKPDSQQVSNGGEKGTNDAQKENKREANGLAKKESVVGTWTAWATEKRKKVFQKEEPVKIERVDIGPAPARPLAQWARRKTEDSSSPRSSSSVGVESISSSTRISIDKKESDYP